MKEKGRKNWKEKQYKEKEEGKDGMFMYTYICLHSKQTFQFNYLCTKQCIIDTSMNVLTKY